VGKVSVTSPAHGALANASVVIWTTTPWTLPGNRAIGSRRRDRLRSLQVTDAPVDNWAKGSDLLILADALAESVFRQARVTATSTRPTCSDAVECAHR
jgi:isoleucyl-tRNA synthetase